MSKAILGMEIRLEHDVVLARQRARQIAGLLGFDAQDQTRIATAVSEVARNAFQYAGGGKVDFSIEGDSRAVRCWCVSVTGGQGSKTSRAFWMGGTGRPPEWGWGSLACDG